MLEIMWSKWNTNTLLVVTSNETTLENSFLKKYQVTTIILLLSIYPREIKALSA